MVDEFGEEDGAKGLNVQIETDEASGSILTYFELPTETIGYSFTAYEDKEIMKVTAGEELLIGAMAFDTGDGVRTVDCRSLTDEPEKIKGYSCVLIIRQHLRKSGLPLSQKQSLENPDLRNFIICQPKTV